MFKCSFLISKASFPVPADFTKSSDSPSYEPTVSLTAHDHWIDKSRNRVANFTKKINFSLSFQESN